MFKKAKKRAASEELRAQRAQCEEQFETRIAQANEVDDPTEKLLQLEKIRQALSNDGIKESNKISVAVGNIHPFGRKQEAIAYGLMLPTLVVGSFLYVNHLEKREGRLTGQFANEARDHFRYLSEKRERLQEMIDALLEEHMQEIVKSPLLQNIILNQPALFEKLVDAHVEVVAKSPLCKDMQDDPGLLRQFAEVALRGGMSLPQGDAAADAATVAIEQEIAAPRKTDYSRLNALRSRRTI